MRDNEKVRRRLGSCLGPLVALPFELASSNLLDWFKLAKDSPACHSKPTVRCSFGSFLLFGDVRFISANNMSNAARAHLFPRMLELRCGRRKVLDDRCSVVERDNADILRNSQPSC